MRTRMTRFLKKQMARVVPFEGADGWMLLRRIENTPDRNCVDVPVEVFFPPIEEFNDEKRKLRERRKIDRECAGCPVADACLAGALLRDERYGGWGGVAQPDFQVLSRLWRQRQKQRAEARPAEGVA